MTKVLLSSKRMPCPHPLFCRTCAIFTVSTQILPCPSTTQQQPGHPSASHARARPTFRKSATPPATRRIFSWDDNLFSSRDKKFSSRDKLLSRRDKNPGGRAEGTEAAKRDGERAGIWLVLRLHILYLSACSHPLTWADGSGAPARLPHKHLAAVKDVHAPHGTADALALKVVEHTAFLAAF